MRVTDAIKSPLNEKALYLLEVYKNANQTVAKAKDLDDQVLAYGEALNKCLNGKCSAENEKTRNAVLYWAYHSMADALVAKNFNAVYDFDVAHFDKALNYYNAALNVAETDDDRVFSMHKIAKVHKYLNDEESWFKVRNQLIDYLPNSEKRHAYVSLANEYAKSPQEEEILEKALSFVAYENVSDKVKQRNKKHICDRLIKAYQRDGKLAELRRIEQLADGD